MKTRISLRRTARSGGHMGLGLTYHLALPTLTGVSEVAMQREITCNLVLWQLRVILTSKPRRNYQIW